MVMNRTRNAARRQDKARPGVTALSERNALAKTSAKSGAPGGLPSVGTVYHDRVSKDSLRVTAVALCEKTREWVVSVECGATHLCYGQRAWSRRIPTEEGNWAHRFEFVTGGLAPHRRGRVQSKPKG